MKIRRNSLLRLLSMIHNIYAVASEPLAAGVKEGDIGVVKRNEQSINRNSQVEKTPSRDGSSR